MDGDVNKFMGSKFFRFFFVFAFIILHGMPLNVLLEISKPIYPFQEHFQSILGNLSARMRVEDCFPSICWHILSRLRILEEILSFLTVELPSSCYSLQKWPRLTLI